MNRLLQFLSLSNTSIGVQLSALAGVPIVCLLAIVLGTSFVERQGAEIRAERENLGTALEYLAKSEGNLLVVQQSISSLVLDRDPNAIAAYDSAINQTIGALEIVGESLSGLGKAEGLAEIQAAVQAHKLEMGRLASVSEKLGFSEDEGKEGELRSAVHGIEKL